MARFQAGELPILPREFEAEQADINAELEVHDSLEDSVAMFVSGRGDMGFSMSDIFDAWKIPPDRQDRSLQTRIGVILTKLGFATVRTRIPGGRRREFRKTGPTYR